MTRKRNAAWKGIYGTDRRYTRRVDRAIARGQHTPPETRPAEEQPPANGAAVESADMPAFTCPHARSSGACPHCLGVCGCHGTSAEAVWATLEAQPGFSEQLAHAERDIAEGRGTPMRELRP